MAGSDHGGDTVTLNWTRTARHAGALAVALALAVGAGAAQAPLVPGDPLPMFKGTDLAGHGVTLPDAAKGKVAVYLFGFSYGSRAPVEAWSEHVRGRWGAEAQVTWFQVPMIGGFGRLAKPFITGGMKKETPPQYHGNAVVVFGGVGAWKTRLSVKDDALAYIVLVDRAGVVRWLHAGAFAAARAEELDAQVQLRLAGTAQP